MDRYSVPSDVYRVLCAIDDAKRTGNKEAAVALADLEGFVSFCSDEVTRLEQEVTDLGREVDSKESEIERLYDDVARADDKVTEIKLKMASANVRLNKLRELVNNIEL